MKHHLILLSTLASLFALAAAPSFAQAVAEPPVVYNQPGYDPAYTRWENYFYAANNKLDGFNAKVRQDAAAASNAAPQGSYSVASGGSPILNHFHVQIPKHAIFTSARVNDDERTIYCTSGTTLALDGDEIKGVDYVTCELLADRRRVDIDKVCPITQKYLLYWTATDPGDHTLRVVFTSPGGQGVTARLVVVKVIGTAPIGIDKLPDALVNSDSESIITRTSSPDFKPTRAEILVNDAGFPLKPEQVNLFIPASHMPDGNYDVSVAAYDSSGERFVSMPKTVKVIHAR